MTGQDFFEYLLLSFVCFGIESNPLSFFLNSSMCIRMEILSQKFNAQFNASVFFSVSAQYRLSTWFAIFFCIYSVLL